MLHSERLRVPRGHLSKSFLIAVVFLFSLPASHAGALVPHGGDLEHEPPGALAVARLREVEEDGVQEAVHAGEGPGALVDHREEVPRAAVRAGHGAHHQVRRLGQVEGQEADAEDHRHHHDHPHRLLPLLAAGGRDALVGGRPAQHLRHAAIAQHDAGEGQQEAEAGERHAVRVVVQRAVRRAQVVAHGAVALGARGGEVEGGGAQQHDEQPHAAAHAPHQPPAALLVPDGQRVADAHVAVHADAGEEQDAAVEVTVGGEDGTLFVT